MEQGCTHKGNDVFSLLSPTSIPLIIYDEDQFSSMHGFFLFFLSTVAKLAKAIIFQGIQNIFILLPNAAQTLHPPAKILRLCHPNFRFFLANAF
jgi:hypothetical protein